jgi:hypothetical protein
METCKKMDIHVEGIDLKKNYITSIIDMESSHEWLDYPNKINFILKWIINTSL